MNICIRNGRVMDPQRQFDQLADVWVADGRIAAITPPGEAPSRVPSAAASAHDIDAAGCWVLPGLVDLSVRLGEPGREHKGMLASETAACVAGGVTSVLCPPDTDPVLDEPGLVEMLALRAAQQARARVFALGALTSGLRGEALSEMAALTRSGCVGFAQARAPLPDARTLLRTLQYAATWGYTVWLHPQEPSLSRGVAASGALAQRLGLAGVPTASETIALHTIVELVRSSGARVHLCRLSSAAGVALLRRAKDEGLPVSADVSIHNLLLTDSAIGHFDSSARLNPPLRQARDREALGAALADGTIDALVSDHTPVDTTAKTLPFAEAEPGASAVELLLPLAVQWAEDRGVPLLRALQCVTSAPAALLGEKPGGQAALGQLREGAAADLCVVDPQARWPVAAHTLHSQAKSTPFAGREMPVRVRQTLVGGRVVFGAC